MKFRTSNGQLLEIDPNTIQDHTLILGDTAGSACEGIADLMDAIQTGHPAVFTSVSALDACDIIHRIMGNLKATSRARKKHEPRSYSKPTPWPAR